MTVASHSLFVVPNATGKTSSANAIHGEVALGTGSSLVAAEDTVLPERDGVAPVKNPETIPGRRVLSRKIHEESGEGSEGSAIGEGGLVIGGVTVRRVKASREPCR